MHIPYQPSSCWYCAPSAAEAQVGARLRLYLHFPPLGRILQAGSADTKGLHLELAQMVDGVQAVVIVSSRRVASKVQDDELGQTPQVPHLPDTLYLVTPTIELHQGHQA